MCAFVLSHHIFTVPCSCKLSSRDVSESGPPTSAVLNFLSPLREELPGDSGSSVDESAYTRKVSSIRELEVKIFDELIL